MMDRSWMYLSRVSKRYRDGVEEFLQLAFTSASINGKIICPCVKCGNAKWVEEIEAREHLICDGFIKGYTKWVAHGEARVVSPPVANTSNDVEMRDDMHGMLHDAFGLDNVDELEEDRPDLNDEPNEDAAKFYKLLKDAEEPLYEDCENYSILSFVVRLFHLKCKGKMTNGVFTELLETLNDAFPMVKKLPKSYYETKKIMGALGLSYTKIDACPNDCMLYWKSHANDQECHVCGTSRWKSNEGDDEDESTSISGGKKVAAKVLRHFPLKPRLQRLFMSSKTASLMSWHQEDRTKDGCMRHPADSPAWQTFDFKNADFAKDPRNVRLGLACDGFNPNRTMSSTYSTWPVVLIPYNLPPWLCMKQPHFMLSLLIPGPTAPGNNLDVYLQPLIDELIDLWVDGLETYDASKKENFQMRAALLWTISDFPAFANLSGWSTKGQLACPSCHKQTDSQWLIHSGKHCYMGHRRFLDEKHPFRKQKGSFNGKEENAKAPSRLTGSMVLNELSGVSFRFGREVKDNPKLPHNWKKRSIFFDLPYWKDNLVRHNLDVMHIEKNVCDSVLGTLLNLDGKTKDHRKSRLDLKEMGIRKELHPVPRESGREYLPPCCFSLSRKEKEIVCDVLKKVKVPDGYAANISRCIQFKPPKIIGLKSHDNHILMQQLLPIALRRVLSKQVRSPLIELCSYFRELCSKVLRPRDLIRLEGKIAITLCQLEMIFPPSFFDVMMHLPIHLATEAKLAGPVHYRWMYPIERYLCTLKSYVRNRSHPEGTIAEGYLAEECITFCSRYLKDVETKLNRPGRNDDDGNVNVAELPIFGMSGRPLGKEDIGALDTETLKEAHRYVLFNCDAINHFIEKHQDVIKAQNRRARVRDIERLHNETFPSWLATHVRELFLAEDDQISEEIRALARGPHIIGKRYKGFIVNGFRFHVKDMEKRRKTQNSGVILSAKTTSFASARDNNPVVGEVMYYGVIKDIIELDYLGGNKVVLFKCDWVSGGKRKREDEHGFTCVNFTELSTKKDPFVLASQVQQVFYVNDPVEKGWKIVVKTSPRDYYDMGEESSADDVETFLRREDYNIVSHDKNEEISWVRHDMEGIIVEVDKNS